MRTKSLRLFVAYGSALLLACAHGGCGTLFTNVVFQPLEFPLANPADIARIAAFGIPNWSGTEPHNGIDLIVNASLQSTRLVSPTAGTVKAVTASENRFSNPPGQVLITIAIRVNSEWMVNLVLEPSTADPVLRDAQLAAILVSEGQQVSPGTPVADLLVGTLGYPHLHYMVDRDGAPVCAYANSSDAARAVFARLAGLPNSSLPDGNICYGRP
jgi:murein DD-endopeptidase MepM/ murein hydrolase activator NlpD